MDIKIIVATHKEYKMPVDSVYIPLQVGAINKEKIGYSVDCIGENISIKNSNYCELTGLYWAWKNINCEYIGLVHYRRYFVNRNIFKNKFDRILSKKNIEKKLTKFDVLLPHKRHYVIETNKNQYVHAHHPIGLENTEKAIKKLCPEYLNSWQKMLKSRSGHRFNMFIMKKSIADKYCEWLFNILFEVEKNTDVSSWDTSEKRIYGYLSERLLDVWLDYNNILSKDIPYLFMEKQNWVKKGFKFIKRKFKVRKY